MSVLEAHPHAAAVLGAALRDRPSHAYLFHGPAGSGKREAAREFAAELLSRDAPDPENARARALAGAHPDLTWVAPSGAHIMLRGDVDQSVVAAASHTPFESAWRVFVLERVDTMDDPAANTLLKTLEEPPGYVVLILLTDRPTQVLPTITSRCQGVRFDAPPPGRLAERLESRGVDAASARACARLSLGDGERALALALGDGPALRARAEAFARAPLNGDVGKVKPWTEVARRGADAPATPPRPSSRRRSRPSSSTCPRRSTGASRPSSPSAPAAPRGAPRPARSTTRCSSSASGTATSPAWPPTPRSSRSPPTGSSSCARTP